MIASREVLLRAALLAGEGAGARGLADKLSSLITTETGRSCLDGGAPIQLTVDAPGARELRVGVATGLGFDPARFEGLADASRLEGLGVAARHPALVGLGGWTAWSRSGVDWYVDVRGVPLAELATRLATLGFPVRAPELIHTHATPWVLRLRAGQDGLDRVHLHWLLRRPAPVDAVLDALHPGGARAARSLLTPVFGALLPYVRWVVATPLDDATPPGLRVGCSRWGFVTEDEEKHALVGRVIEAHGGPTAYAGALWSLLRGLASPRWRVGRGVEVRLVQDQPRVRLILVPEPPPG